MAGTRGAKRKRTAAMAGLTMDDVALDLAERRDIDLEAARSRLVNKRLADSSRNAHRKLNQRVLAPPFRVGGH